MIVLEGVRAVALPCTLALLIPGVVTGLAARLRPVALLSFVAAAALLIWGTAIGATLPQGLVWQVGGAVVLAAGFVAAWRGEHGAVVGAGAAVVGIVSTLLWVPCVGRELGAALTSAPTDPAGQLLPLLGYAVGALTPLLALAAVGELASDRVPRWSQRIGAALGGVLVAVLAAGVWDVVVGELVRRSVL